MSEEAFFVNELHFYDDDNLDESILGLAIDFDENVIVIGMGTDEESNDYYDTINLSKEEAIKIRDWFNRAIEVVISREITTSKDKAVVLGTV